MNETTLQLQQDRTDRARTALAAGEIKVTPAPTGWLVVNGDGKQYETTHTDCTCADFTQRGAKQGFTCKHIEAIKILFPQGGQSQMTATPNAPVENGWMKLWHPKGVQVSLPIVYDSAQNMLLQVDSFLEAGWLIDAPGLEAGEQVLEAALVSRRESKDGTPMVAFYLAHPKVFKKSLHAYLNNEQDVAAFEAATGLKLVDIPIFDGEAFPAKDHKNADKYILSLPKPIKLVYKISAKWLKWKAEDGTGEEPHKHMLVRYEGLAAHTPASQPAAQPKPATAPLVREYGDGASVPDDPKAQSIYDAFLKARGQAPMSADGLKAWYAGNKHLVELPKPTAA